MLPLVLVIVTPLHADAEPHLRQMLDACSTGLASGRCVTQGHADEQTGLKPSAEAHVTWASPTEVTIAVQKAGGAGSSRSLRFEASDEPSERWRAVGFTTASMVGGDAAPADQVEDPADPVHLWGLLLLGNGLSSSARTGAALGLEVLPWNRYFAASVSGEYAVTSENAALAARWLSVSAGPGVAFEPAIDLAAAVRAQLLLQSRRVTAVRGPQTDTASEWVWGARLQLDLLWPAHETWAGMISFEGSLFEGATQILQDQRRVAELPVFAASVGVGVRFSP